MRTTNLLSLLLATLTLTGMLVATGVMAGEPTVAQAGLSANNSTDGLPSNETVIAPVDNSTILPPDNATTPTPVPDNNTTVSPTTSPLTLALESHVYYPKDVVKAFVYNATDPLVTLVDPAGASYNLSTVMLNNSSFMAEYALNRGIILANYTVIVTDNVSGETVNDTFEVLARPVVVSPAPNATITPGNETVVQPYYLYVNVSRCDYSPPDKVDITVTTNAGVPVGVIQDPAGNTVHVDLKRVRDNVYEGTYKLDKAVVLGNYAVIAYVHGNGTYDTAITYFNVTLEKSAEKGLKVQYAAYDPALKAIVVRANISTASSDTASAVKNAPAMKGMSVKGVKVLASTPAEDETLATGINEKRDVEVIIPVDNNNVAAVASQFNVTPDIARATTSVAVSADGTNIHLSLNDKLDGCWYRLSANVPAGYSVVKITKADGTAITNNIKTNRYTGEVVSQDTRWYVDNGTLYFYDDPINGYDITLIPPMANNSLAVNVIEGGQLSAIVFPFNQSDTASRVLSNDHLCRDGDNGFGGNNDSDAGSKTSIRMINTQTGNKLIFGNDGETTQLWSYPGGYPTYHGGYTLSNYSTTGYANRYFNISQQIIGFNSVPDGSVESVILTNFSTPLVSGAPSYVNVTQKTIIRNNNLWFATIYYITNNGANNINNIRFTQGADFNFNGMAQNDDDYYAASNDTVFGHKDSSDPNAIHVAGFRSPIPSSAHDVDVYYQLWYKMQTDALTNGTSTRGMYGYSSVDGGMALAWDNASLIRGQTWTIPVIWAVGTNNNSFNNALSYAMSHNITDVGVKSIDLPLAGANLDSLTTPNVTISATAMDVGITDQSPMVYLQITNPAGNIVKSDSRQVTLSVPYQESAPANFTWNLAGVPTGTYNISVYTQMAGDQNATNNLKSISVSVKDFSLYPDQWAHASAGNNVLFPLNLSNLGAQQKYDFSLSASTAGWASNLFYNNTSNMIASDNNGDGVWDWVNASYNDTATGRPSIILSPSSSTAHLLLEKIVPITADSGILDTVTLYAYPSGDPSNNSSAVLRTDTPFGNVANKTFYLHPGNLNTSRETSAKSYTAISAIYRMWAQTPAFADDFTIVGNITVPLYYNTSTAMPITATLFYTNGLDTSVLIGTNTSTIPAYNFQTATLFNYTIVPVTNNITVPRGSYLVLKVDNQQLTNFYVWYSATEQSRIELYTPTYVKVKAIDTYKGSVPATGFTTGDTVYVTANVSDPIGAYDVSAATISIIAPNGTYLANNQSMQPNRTDTASPALWKLFNYSYALSSSLPAGVYDINITGYESNGVVARRNQTITLSSSSPSITIYPDNTTLTPPDRRIDIKHAITNLNANASDVVDVIYSRTLAWPVSFYKADGVTPLPDTDGDGLPDTGTLAPLGTTEIIVSITVPSYAGGGDVDYVNVTARSSQNTSVTSVAHDVISIPVSAVSIYPDATGIGAPGTVVSFNHAVSNLNENWNDTVGISYTSTQGWAVSLYQEDGTTPLQDTNGDGMPDTGPITPLDSVDIVVQVSVPSYANPAYTDVVHVTAHSSNDPGASSQVTDTVYVSANPVVKTLYLHRTATNYLDTSPAYPAASDVTVGTTNVTWTQSSALARDFNILVNPGATLYLYNPDNQQRTYTFGAALKYVNGGTTTTIGYWSGSITIPRRANYTLNINIPLYNPGTNIPAGSRIILDLRSSRSLTLHQSSLAPSHFDMNTERFINVQGVSITNATTNTTIASVTPPSAVKVYAIVTDPFGFQAITGASLSVTDSNGNTALGPYTMSQTAVDGGTPSAWKQYERDVSLPASLDTGNYNFIVTAAEDNGVTHNGGATLPIVYPINVSATKSFESSGSNSWAITIQLTNKDIAHTVKGVHAYDYFSTGYTCSGFSDTPIDVVSVNNGILFGYINVFGPFDLSPGQTKIITYTAQATGNYNITDMYVVGVDPHA